ncbi:TonB-dependent receptor [Marinoscillum furvescens]|uniref:Outer membrane cobalamin receptor n=1 Tax=Marinoscillum furvescens DSM 4134 TaxID=1122208 RepID=A0A3D9L4A4_MARFU|nr:carboxypeptidase-like regulatory domain-containing protein [Marinoscillum furvescens]REE00443.1 outer membrane cobalamin receptor [Marinoscillum furvescens DSM 4134]
MKNVLVTISLLIVAAEAMAQFSLTGQVLDPAGEGIPGVTITVKGTSMGTSSDYEGKFQLDDIEKGQWQLILSGVGFQSQEITVDVDQPTKLSPITLKESTTELAAVQIVGKSAATEIREQAYAVEVVSSKGFKNLSTNANDILGKISGVNIRQSGGLGSNFSLSLNGLSGNQLRLFLDGVPMDYFGSSLSLNNFSANLIDRIEVYKGVVPIHLSSDALGGAINVVTSKNVNSFLDASYSVGSFNTHIASLNGQHRNAKNGFTVRLKSFYNTADNNYEVPVNLVNFETGKEEGEPTWVERFHDGYTSKMAWAEVGFVGTSFADQLMVGLMYSDNYKELQQPANAVGQAKIPYGEVAAQEEKIITNLSYKKSGLLNDRLSLRAYLVKVASNSLSIDTSSYRYDWFGERTLRENTAIGEVENRKTLLNLNLDNYLANFNTEYTLAANHNVAVNYSLNHLNVKGSDRFKAENNTQFSNPSTVAKQVFGFSYTQSFFSQKLKNTFFSKYYRYRVTSLETNYQGSEVLPFEATKQYMGYGVTSTLQLREWQLKASYENATRFPELIELFGDGLNYTPNPSLLPEQSNNYNLGFIYSRAGANPFMLSVNGFVRDAQDFILPLVKGIKASHINNGIVRSAGVDLGMSYQLKSGLAFAANGTYLDKRDLNKWRNGAEGVANSQYKVRVPNEPFLFGNVTVSYRRGGFFGHDQMSASIIQRYVGAFYYRWPNLASQGKDTVPQQWTTNLDIVYSIKNGRYNTSFGIANLWDAEVYDNFLQLRPGRTYNLKFRYFIN